jgi:hypothetical protein
MWSPIPACALDFLPDTGDPAAVHHASSGVPLISDEIACTICRARADISVDGLGTAICARCLRRIDANPRDKRAYMFASVGLLFG